jgi:hypothetical protein
MRAGDRMLRAFSSNDLDGAPSRDSQARPDA